MATQCPRCGGRRVGVSSITRGSSTTWGIINGLVKLLTRFSFKLRGRRETICRLLTTIDQLQQRWESDPLAAQQVDPMDKIARDRGWLPLSQGESMTVHFGPRTYRIRRIEDMEQ